ncbi:MAG: F0F1 ATP synthase subunit A [Ruminococcaceae bacterium]|nr:F0F1 ATP synthase subunit A [Oscillospiraceae bacterium]
MIIYTALSLLSTTLIRLIASSILLPLILVALGVFLLFLGIRKKKLLPKILAIVFGVLGILGLATCLELLGDVQIPILQVGVPAVLSIYFDLFSGFVQAFVFSLLSMVYIAGVCPPPEIQE